MLHGQLMSATRTSARYRVDIPGGHDERPVVQCAVQLDNVSDDCAHRVFISRVLFGAIVDPCVGLKVDAELVKVRRNIQAFGLHGRDCLIDREERSCQRLDPLFLEDGTDGQTSSCRGYL